MDSRYIHLQVSIKVHVHPAFFSLHSYCPALDERNEPDAGPESDSRRLSRLKTSRPRARKPSRNLDPIFNHEFLGSREGFCSRS